jgi:hypothetical protein
MPDPLKIDVAVETWPIAGAFVIARGAKREATVVVARVSDGDYAGRGECVPYARYGETVESVCTAIAALPHVPDRARLLQEMPAGAARNALDCALWDYEAKRDRVTAAQMAGRMRLRPLNTCYTLSLDTADAMAGNAAAAVARGLPLLKLKLDGAGDALRMCQVRAACPNARLVADARTIAALGGPLRKNGHRNEGGRDKAGRRHDRCASHTLHSSSIEVLSASIGAVYLPVRADAKAMFAPKQERHQAKFASRAPAIDP